MKETHAEARDDPEHGERDGLRLVEVRDVEEGPVLGDEDERVEVRLREVEREKVEEPDPRRDDDRAVRQEAPRDDGPLREEDLPDRDHGQEDAAHDEHCDHRGWQRRRRRV